jgi:hypothetical protein
MFNVKGKISGPNAQSPGYKKTKLWIIHIFRCIADARAHPERMAAEKKVLM